MGLVKFSQSGLLANPTAQAFDSAHSLAFHHGLGAPLVPAPSVPMNKYVDAEGIAAFAQGAYSKSSIGVVASGASVSNLSKWVGEFFTDTPSATVAGPFSPLASQPTKYFGGEERISSQAGNAVVIAFPGSSFFGSTASYKPEFAVLAALFGGESSIKWSNGSSLLSKVAEANPQAQVSTKHVAYSDAGLLYITVTGKAEAVGAASKSVVDTIKEVAAGKFTSEDIKKAIALAKFRALEAGQNIGSGLELTATGLIHHGKPYHVTEVGQSFDKVTEQQVKTVCFYLILSSSLLFIFLESMD